LAGVPGTLTLCPPDFLPDSGPIHERRPEGTSAEAERQASRLGPQPSDSATRGSAWAWASEAEAGQERGAWARYRSSASTSSSWWARTSEFSSAWVVAAKACRTSRCSAEMASRARTYRQVLLGAGVGGDLLVEAAVARCAIAPDDNRLTFGGHLSAYVFFVVVVSFGLGRGGNGAPSFLMMTGCRLSATLTPYRFTSAKIANTTIPPTNPMSAARLSPTRSCFGAKHPSPASLPASSIDLPDRTGR
jgi:hypothetical protein